MQHVYTHTIIVTFIHKYTQIYTNIHTNDAYIFYDNIKGVCKFVDHKVSGFLLEKELLFLQVGVICHCHRIT
jgi:hypothetical protein